MLDKFKLLILTQLFSFVLKWITCIYKLNTFISQFFYVFKHKLTKLWAVTMYLLRLNLLVLHFI